MSRPTPDQPVCPNCHSRPTHCAGNLGQRTAGRCSGCGRTFWPQEKGSGALPCIKNLLGVRAL